jgi:hypothetical protein
MCVQVRMTLLLRMVYQPCLSVTQMVQLLDQKYGGQHESQLQTVGRQGDRRHCHCTLHVPGSLSASVPHSD